MLLSTPYSVKGEPSPSASDPLNAAETAARATAVPNKLRETPYGSIWLDAMYGQWSYGPPVAVGAFGFAEPAQSTGGTWFLGVGSSISSGLIGDSNDRVSIGLNYVFRQVSDSVENHAKASSGDVETARKWLSYAGVLQYRPAPLDILFARTTIAKFRGVSSELASNPYALPFGHTRGPGVSEWASDFYRGELGIQHSGARFFRAFFWLPYVGLKAGVPAGGGVTFLNPFTPVGCLIYPLFPEDDEQLTIFKDGNTPDRSNGASCSLVVETYAAPFRLGARSFDKTAISLRSAIWFNDPFAMDAYPEAGFAVYFNTGIANGVAGLKDQGTAATVSRAFQWTWDAEGGPWYKFGAREGLVLRAYGRFSTTTITNLFGNNQFSYSTESIYGMGLAAGLRL